MKNNNLFDSWCNHIWMKYDIIIETQPRLAPIGRGPRNRNPLFSYFLCNQPTPWPWLFYTFMTKISKAWRFSLQTNKSSDRSVFNFQTFVHERYDYVWKPAVGKSNESMLLRQFKQNIKSIDLQSICQWSHFLISKMLFIAGGLSDYHKITCLLPWLQISKLYILSNI